ncbi:hypothetical protein HDV03_001837 [Kappamyces sp. JEL0829]|nr:hypothetical protein HDV03_001837 [Kappamyces sp. JEL0829]
MVSPLTTPKVRNARLGLGIPIPWEASLHNQQLLLTDTWVDLERGTTRQDPTISTDLSFSSQSSFRVIRRAEDEVGVEALWIYKDQSPLSKLPDEYQAIASHEDRVVCWHEERDALDCYRITGSSLSLLWTSALDRSSGGRGWPALSMSQQLVAVLAEGPAQLELVLLQTSDGGVVSKVATGQPAARHTSASRVVFLSDSILVLFGQNDDSTSVPVQLYSTQGALLDSGVIQGIASPFGAALAGSCLAVNWQEFPEDDTECNHLHVLDLEAATRTAFAAPPLCQTLSSHRRAWVVTDQEEGFLLDLKAS